MWPTFKYPMFQTSCEHTLKIHVCPKKGITATFLFFSDGIGILTPILGGVLDS